MDDSDLCTLIDRQSRRAIGADDLTADQRAEAMDFYHGEAKGRLAPPDVPGRSSVVSKDLLDTVEWAMPAIMDVLCGSDDVIKFEPDGPEDEQACMDATNYVGYLIHRKNEDGFTTIHDAVKSALISRVGIGKCYVEETQDYREERYSGLTQQEVDLLGQDPELEVLEVTPDGAVPSPMSQPGQPPEMVEMFTVRARLSETVKQFRNEGVPPEEIRIARDTRVINECRFIEHRREVTLSYLREQGYDEDKIDRLSGDGEDSDDEVIARHDYDESEPESGDETDDSQRKVWLSESYLKVDYDGDGRTEYRRVVKANNVIFENEVVDDHPFWLLTPLLMPYKIIGISFWDLVEDLQRIKTALNRQVLDNLYLSNNGRTEVVSADVIDMDELLSPRVGGVVQVKRMGTIREIPTPFIAGPGMEMMAAIDAVRDTRTGITEMNSALSAESFAQSNVGSEGVQAMMNSGAQRLRLITRVLVETGIKRMYYLMLKNITQHADKAQQVKINGRWLQVDPREWKNKYNMTVSVGVGTFGRQQQISNLQMIAQMQQGLMGMGLATPVNVFNAAKRAIEAMGYRDADQFISPPQMGPDGQPQKPPNPEAQKAEQEMQAKQAELSMLYRAKQEDRTMQAQLERERMEQQRATDVNRQQAEMEQQADKAAREFAIRELEVASKERQHERELMANRDKWELEAATKIQVAQMSSMQAPGIASMAAEQEIAREVRP